MAKKRAKAAESERWGVYLTTEQAEGLRQLKASGINPAHVIREAIDKELAARGIKTKGGKHGR